MWTSFVNIFTWFLGVKETSPYFIGSSPFWYIAKMSKWSTWRLKPHYSLQLLGLREELRGAQKWILYPLPRLFNNVYLQWARQNATPIQAQEEPLTSRGYYSRENRDKALSGTALQTLSFPFHDGHTCRTVCPGSKLGFHCHMQGKTNNGLLHRASGSFSQRWASSLIRWGFGAPATEPVWESVLKSPEQFRNYFSCSHFRSKTKTPSRNKHMLLCLYF